MLHQYNYRPKWTTIIGCALFLGAGAFLFCMKALGNHQGLIIHGIVELSPAGAGIFYWVLTVACAGLFIGAAAMAVAQLSLRQRITLNERCIIFPRSAWSNEENSVPFENIQELKEWKVHSQRLLEIVFNGGKFTLSASSLPHPADFDEIRELLAHRVDANRSAAE